MLSIKRKQRDFFILLRQHAPNMKLDSTVADVSPSNPKIDQTMCAVTNFVSQPQSLPLGPCAISFRHITAITHTWNRSAIFIHIPKKFTYRGREPMGRRTSSNGGSWRSHSLLVLPSSSICCLPFL